MTTPSTQKPIDKAARTGHPIRMRTIDANEVDAHPGLIEAIHTADCTGVIVRGALPLAMVAAAVARLGAGEMDWASPNKGMYGGELRTIGDAATPTFTALRGPDADRYAQSAKVRPDQTRAVFGDVDPVEHLSDLFSRLNHGQPAAPPAFEGEQTWAPLNYRALDPGVQIYAHHDNHYGLSVYQHMPADLDRDVLLSWFVTLQAPDAGGELIIYGLWGSDPNPPVLPTRFLDTAALERDFKKEIAQMQAGDLIIFDAGRHVHRVSPVEGEAARLTFGGFLTVDTDRTRLAFWS